jgi:hypothetical protein
MSISKLITIVEICMLVDLGRLKLTDTIDKYFPEYKNITIDELLSHTSGIDSNWDPTTDIYKSSRNRHVGKKIQSYNNYGYFLLSYIVDEIYGAKKLLSRVAQRCRIKWRITCSHDIPIGAYGIYMSSRDLCKFAERYTKLLTPKTLKQAKKYMLKYKIGKTSACGYDGSSGQYLIITKNHILVSLRQPKENDYNNMSAWDLTPVMQDIFNAISRT